jgi:Protein of unknown function (DUF1344)
VKAFVQSNFRHIRKAICQHWNDRELNEVGKMRFFVATLLATASFLAPVAGFAESADVEATIKMVDADNFHITLDDGKMYQAPADFDFAGLEAGVKVIVFYTEVDGKRVINDLDVIHTA